MFVKTVIVFFAMLAPLHAFYAVPANCENIEEDASFIIDTDRDFKVDIDIDAAEITVRPSEDIRECRVELEYDTVHFRPDIKFDSQRNRLDVTIDCENLFKHNDNGDNCGDDHEGCGVNQCTKMEIVIELPYGPETAIDAEIKAGEVEFQLGGLAVSEFRLRCLAGETTVAFDQPNRAVCRRFDVHTMVGETKLVSLGNGRLEDADINSGIGELKLDFSGIAADGVNARIDLDLGETQITVPDNIGVKARVSRFMFFSNMQCPCGFNKRGKNYYSENYDSSDKRLTLDITAGIGELKMNTCEQKLSQF